MADRRWLMQMAFGAAPPSGTTAAGFLSVHASIPNNSLQSQLSCFIEVIAYLSFHLEPALT
jgi:hypothetical protein